MKRLAELNYPAKCYALLALGLLTAAGLKLVFDLQLLSGRRPYMFMFWNVFLAWLPVLFMLGLDGAFLLRSAPLRKIMILVFGALWLGFYPNAAYLVTDLLHMFANYQFDQRSRFWQELPFWNHLLALLLTSVLGLLLGAFSLHSVHQLVSRSLGRLAGWMFALAILALSSFGIYMGRFVRWNSWDILTSPAMMARDLLGLATDAAQLAHAISFCGRMFALTALTYLALYAFTGLKGNSPGKMLSGQNEGQSGRP
ncbi:DUF1361 domain-containing protein [Paenibacillus caui]|uniref:DUF1361 domain-containing protein n=1 Tax=Paenibacillus caui TaxID=2873927 RepID=UPI001CA8BA97|nr:DUF1361 domain-containing protein [Paenibacillus caui]